MIAKCKQEFNTEEECIKALENEYCNYDITTHGKLIGKGLVIVGKKRYALNKNKHATLLTCRRKFFNGCIGDLLGLVVRQNIRDKWEARSPSTFVELNVEQQILMDITRIDERNLVVKEIKSNGGKL